MTAEKGVETGSSELAQWHIPVIVVLGSLRYEGQGLGCLRQKDQELEDSLGYIADTSPQKNNKMWNK